MDNKDSGKGFFSRKLLFGTSLALHSSSSLQVSYLWAGFNWTLEVTNTEEFCISCHEMRDNVFEEYKNTIHYSNRSGVRATCPDCHVPKEYHHKIMRKIHASNELYHKILGTIDTAEKYEAKRHQLAQHVWQGMEQPTRESAVTATTSARWMRVNRKLMPRNSMHRLVHRDRPVYIATRASPTNCRMNLWKLNTKNT